MGTNLKIRKTGFLIEGARNGPQRIPVEAIETMLGNGETGCIPAVIITVFTLAAVEKLLQKDLQNRNASGRRVG
ncbi:hypothetical protein N7532_005243 [Penicillium argentinense]|uniref:Uncharacterized protein n=1 Tax=Penicillium argentinense TaxID=1131581 RepID=A0A9W9FE49_9EURO|nr:uncharacterized protein N7532_005243 [Penicillium argentinense]KAJ5098242.1 hypothetical protein N7532_005243 [Penicillium argentinense]